MHERRGHRLIGVPQLGPRAMAAVAVVADVERRFIAFIGPEAPLPEPARFVGGARVESRDLEQVHIALAMNGVPQRDPSLYSLQVFTNILGGGMSSRLFQEIREQRGLCYSIYSFHAAYSDVGMFGLYSGTDASDVPELMRVVEGITADMWPGVPVVPTMGVSTTDSRSFRAAGIPIAGGF